MPQTDPPKYVMNILLGLQAHGHSAYLVGGCVRDMLMGLEPNDWDICTSALPDEVLAIFPGSRPTGIKHGTVTVTDGAQFSEVTTFRTEGDYRDHRRPDSISFVSDLMIDLGRRDFTMNAIALSADGMLSDPYGGKEDIRAGCIRCVGEPQLRFTEDSLRMFRALRFSAKLGFAVEQETLRAIELCAPLAAELAPERVREELERILLSPRPEALGAVLSLGLLDRYVSRAGKEFPAFRGISSLPGAALSRWCAFAVMLKKGGLIHTVGAFLESLRLDGHTVRCCSDAANILSEGLPDSSFGWKKLLSHSGRDAVSYAAETHDMLCGTDCEKELKAVLESGECFSLRQLALNGDDLLELGLRGHELGNMLDHLLDHVMKHPDNNRREFLLELAEKRRMTDDSDHG